MPLLEQVSIKIRRQLQLVAYATFYELSKNNLSCPQVLFMMAWFPILVRELEYDF